MSATVGDYFTTQGSGIKGIVKEVHDRGATQVLLLDVNGFDRWTTAVK